MTLLWAKPLFLIDPLLPCNKCVESFNHEKTKNIFVINQVDN